jgi:hypothetical protein
VADRVDTPHLDFRRVLEFIGFDDESQAICVRSGHERPEGDVAMPGAVALRLGIASSSVHRYLKEGVSVYVADRIANLLGTHPLVIWPEWADDLLDEQELIAC